MRRGPIVVVLLAALGIPSAAGQATQDEQGDWIVSGVEVFEAQTIQLDRNITVRPGGALSFVDTNVTVHGLPQGRRVIMVEPGGEMRLVGATSLWAVSESYSLVVQGALEILGRPDARVEISGVAGSSAGGTVFMENVAINGLLVRGTLRGEHFTYRGGVGGIVGEEAEEISLAHCIVETRGLIAAVFGSVRSASLDRCVLTSKATGLFMGKTSLTVSDSLVRGGEFGYGAFVRDSRLLARDARFFDSNVTIKIVGDSRVDLERVWLVNYTRYGVHSPPGSTSRPIDVSVRHSTFAPSPGGAISGVSLPRIGHGVFDGNQVGFNGDSGFAFGPAEELTITDNVLYGNGRFGLVLSDVRPTRVENNSYGDPAHSEGGPHYEGTEHGDAELVGGEENGVGRVFEYRRLTFRTTDADGRALPGARLSVVVRSPPGNGINLTQDYGTMVSDGRSRVTLEVAPYHAEDNNGTAVRFVYDVDAAMDGYAPLHVSLQPEDPSDVVIALSVVTDGEDDGAASPTIGGIATMVLGAVVALAMTMHSRRRKGG